MKVLVAQLRSTLGSSKVGCYGMIVVTKTMKKKSKKQFPRLRS